MSKRFFFDTSALIKLYHEENGTDQLSDLISSENPIIVISDLTMVEMISALAKKVRTGEIDERIFNEAVFTYLGHTYMTLWGISPKGLPSISFGSKSMMPTSFLCLSPDVRTTRVYTDSPGE
ncbi:MAG: hypothetical protein DRI57_18650 [Deltaproteobacteria bacterium]|nr:MAG: hypothetical protein DRI57_18650 [Deltaproteobacteria bacterium]